MGLHNMLLQVDTSSTGYKVGYYFGAWLPFLILGTIAFLIIRFRKPKS